MVDGVLLTFLGADAARKRAGFDHRAEHFLIGSGPPRGERSGRVANVGAIEIEPNALPERRHVLFRDARISTRRARLRASVAGFDAGDQGVADTALYVGMGGDYFSCVHCYLHVFRARHAQTLVHVRARHASIAQAKSG
jgi:hypothetical protein